MCRTWPGPAPRLGHSVTAVSHPYGGQHAEFLFVPVGVCPVFIVQQKIPVLVFPRKPDVDKRRGCAFYEFRRRLLQISHDCSPMRADAPTRMVAGQVCARCATVRAARPRGRRRTSGTGTVLAGSRRPHAAPATPAAAPTGLRPVGEKSVPRFWCPESETRTGDSGGMRSAQVSVSGDRPPTPWRWR